MKIGFTTIKMLVDIVILASMLLLALNKTRVKAPEACRRNRAQQLEPGSAVYSGDKQECILRMTLRRCSFCHFLFGSDTCGGWVRKVSGRHAPAQMISMATTLGSNVFISTW